MIKWIAAMFLNLLKAGLVCPGRLVPLCSNSQSDFESACDSTVAGSKTGFQWSIRDCRIMFRVRDLVFWRDSSELGSGPGTRVSLGCRNLGLVQAS